MANIINVSTLMGAGTYIHNVLIMDYRSVLFDSNIDINIQGWALRYKY